MRFPLVVSAIALLALGCGSGSSVINVPDTQGDSRTADQAGEPDRSVEPDLVVEPDEQGEPDLVFDTGPDVPFVECEPGTGCFLDPCETNGDCQSAWCVEHMGETVCTQTCQEDCPPGWTCKAVGAGGPDLTWICVSDHANLCKPCNTGDNCKSVGGSEDVCVDYGEEGSFCGGACLSDEDCPWGFSCGETVTVDGISTKQCLADAGVCPCTERAVELALWTACEVTNEFGTCEGKRVCTAEGLTECDAAAPSTEICNGVDDDCDGEIDEPTAVGGEYKNLCDDGNQCTDDWCDPAEGCLHSNTEQKECGDGDACTVGDHCEAGICVGQLVNCDDQNPCTTDSCDAAGGCIHGHSNEKCDDGDPCTVADQCDQGECLGVAVECDCQSDADCDALEDGNLCNGTLVCSKEKLPYQCSVDPATVVSCPGPQGPDAPCLAAACDPETGACSFAPDHEGYPCDDGDKCTIGDLCTEGECTPGVPANCNDGNVCTDDSCNPAEGCVHAPNNAPCNDGDACTLADQCGQASCQPGAPKNCDDGNICTTDWCDPAEGCAHGNSNEKCDDGNACTQGDACANGLCKAGAVIDCDDDNPCTKDGCIAALGCTHQAVAGPCDDGDPCTLNDACVNAVCAPGAQVNCDDGNPCTADSCGANGLCTHVPADGECNDATECTVGDHCEECASVHSGVPDCDDDNPCTTDACDPKKGCMHLVNSSPCDDGNVCTTGDTCEMGECVGNEAFSCNDNNPCTDDTCDPKTGCEFTPNSAACDDGNKCTENDLCANGTCLGADPVDCDDDNVCTNDSCSPKLGCVHTFNTAPCNDADACTVGESCILGLCEGGKPLNCNDGNVCTQDTCDAKVGCFFVDNDVACSDGNACTENDQCVNGECLSGPALDCDDDNVCTLDTCHPGLGCQHTPQDGNCDDDDLCTVTDTCVDGICVGSGDLECVDGNPCTDDGCSPATGCTFVANVDPCDDNNACTTNDACFQGSCKGGPAPDCNDSNECTTDSCDTEQGCLHTPVANGTPCTQNGGTQCFDGVCEVYVPGHEVFTYTGGAQTFTVPPGVKTVRVAVVGGGGGGAGSHYGGGGSGYVLYGQYDVSGTVSVTVGKGGNGGISGTNDAPGSPGSSSSFGGYLSASGGNGGNTNGPGGGHGGSGGGGAGNSGCGGKGGSGGSNGQNGCSYPGGNGGHFDNLAGAIEASLSAGAGGAAGTSSHAGGGGAGGLLINGAGPSAGNGGESWSGKGGVGYGSGGGAGGYNGPRPPGGAGAHGVVYVEW